MGASLPGLGCHQGCGTRVGWDPRAQPRERLPAPRPRAVPVPVRAGRAAAGEAGLAALSALPAV